MITDRSDPGGIAIRRGGRHEIPLLQPLWESLHRHHVAIAPHLRQLGEVRSPAESWAVRAELYEEWLGEPDAFVLLAEHAGEPVGYALVHLREREESWGTSDRIAELETLTVLPAYRGRGIGSLLVEAVYEQLRRVGVAQLGVSVISSNRDAIRFYERLGLLQFVVSYLGNVPTGEQPSERPE